MEGGRAGPGGDCEAIGEAPSSSREQLHETK